MFSLPFWGGKSKSDNHLIHPTVHFLYPLPPAQRVAGVLLEPIAAVTGEGRVTPCASHLIHQKKKEMKIILKNTEDKQQTILHPACGATSTELEHPLCASSCHCARCTADELSRMRPPIRGRPCSPQGRRWWWWWRWRAMGTTCACPFDYLAQGALCTCRLLTRHAAACLFLRRQHCWPSPLHPLLLQQRGGGGGGGGIIPLDSHTHAESGGDGEDTQESCDI